ncbi:hypothetical protein [Ferrovum sp.]|uniref:hypothetical protein n=1 Tax=Ferrovum sp. TaxID=2609467 RepID=UPI00262785E5|nr:hypothetical protein [Ferrovum sp.]
MPAASARRSPWKWHCRAGHHIVSAPFFGAQHNTRVSPIASDILGICRALGRVEARCEVDQKSFKNNLIDSGSEALMVLTQPTEESTMKQVFTQQHVTDHFIIKSGQILTLLCKMKTMRAEGFGIDEDNATWDDVGDLERICKLLQEAMDAVAEKTTRSKVLRK